MILKADTKGRWMIMVEFMTAVEDTKEKLTRTEEHMTLKAGTPEKWKTAESMTAGENIKEK